MKKSYITILLLLMVMILGISAVSAADVDKSNDLTAISDESALEVDDSIEEIQSSDESEILAESGNNFTTLQDEINEEGKSSLTLTKDYVRVSGDSDIEINKDFTIDGANTYNINADNLGGIFKVNNGYTLTLIGVTLVNGNAVNGGAVYNDGGTVNVDNCKFFDNTAAQSGGAIYNNAGTLTVSGSTFDGNDLTQRTKNGWGGAAIYDNAGTVIISTSTISNNLKDIVHRGGTGTYTGDLSSAAVTSENGDLTVLDSRFENNSGSYGGAILSNGANAVLTVSGSTFINNFAFNGAAIDFAGNSYTITDSTFKGNKARGTGSSNSNYAHGGAICAQEKNSDSLISGCTFEDNSAVMGGAISCDDTRIVDCTFTNNTAQAAYSETYNGKANNRGGSGAAIYNDGKITIEDSNFTDNDNKRKDGIYVQNAEITGSSFTDTRIKVSDGPLTISDNTYNNKDGIDISTANYPDIYFDGIGDIPKVAGNTAKLYYDANSFTDLQTLIDTGSEATIYLTGDITKLADEEETFANGILINGKVTLDAASYTITSNNGKVFTVAESGTLVLYNAKIVGDGTAAIVNNAAVTLSTTKPTTFENVGEYAIDNKGRVTENSLKTFTQLNDLICLVNGGEVYIGSSKITKTDEEKETFKDGIVN